MFLLVSPPKSAFRRLEYLSLTRARCRPVIHLNLSLRDHHESHSFVVRFNLETIHKSSICESDPRSHHKRYVNNAFTVPLFFEQSQHYTMGLYHPPIQGDVVPRSFTSQTSSYHLKRIWEHPFPYFLRPETNSSSIAQLQLLLLS